MPDEKDMEIARLRGQLEARRSRGGGAGLGTLKVLGVLAVVAVVGFLALLLIGRLAPPEPTLEERQAECERIHGPEPSEAANRCMMRNLARELQRRR